MHDGLEGYRAFAPPGWEPPEGDRGRVVVRLSRADVWCLVAEEAGVPVGHVAFMPAPLSHRPDAPDVAHLWQLFVREPHWGTGLATTLLGRAVAEARERDFAQMRLFAAAGQARARRFYEREGFAAVGEPFVDDFGLPLLEYRRVLRH